MSLVTLNFNSDKELIERILDCDDVTIYEDIQGTKIFVNWDGDHFNFKQSNINTNEINIVDIALQKFYNSLINYLSTLDDRIKSLLNKKWWFGFEYFADNQPANIEYNKIPKNNLILTSIFKDSKFSYTEEELIEYSNLLNVDHLPIIFKGKLNQTQIEAINYFLNTSKKDLEYVFDESNFAYFFYKILNPNLESSFLMNKDNFQDNLEKLIINCKNEDNKSFQILNPLYSKINNTNSTEFIEIYSLILINFLEFCQIIDINKILLKSKRRDEMYIELICRLFNTYIDDVKDDILNLNIVVPNFFNKEKFRINIEVIPNKLTVEYIQENKKLEYIFKVILGSFIKRKKRVIGLFTDTTLTLFNIFVDQLQSYIDKKLNYNSEKELVKNSLLNFSDYIHIKYDVDSTNSVYPTIEEEDFKEPNIDKKAKKGVEKEMPIELDNKSITQK